MPDSEVLTPNPSPSPTDVEADVAKESKESKEKIAIDTLHNVLNEVMSALKKIGEDIDNINKRVSTLEKSISVKVVGDKISVDDDGDKSEKPKLGDYKVDTVTFAKSTVRNDTPVVTESATTNPEVQIIKSILTAPNVLSADEVYRLVRKNIRPNGGV
jgi:nitrate reductase NapAB chaperone NapD